MKLDKSIVLTFLLFSILALMVSAYKIATVPEDCSKTDFEIGSTDFSAGKIVSFADKTPKASLWSWDFGDNTTPSKEKTPIHIYKSPGQYLVKLIVNDNCEISRTVTIRNSYVPVDSSFYPEFEAPLSATVGVPVKFFDMTPNAKSWEWSFGETGILSTAKAPVYVYRTPGKKTITLVVNGRKDYSTTKRITVLPKPLEKIKIEQKAPVIVKAPPKPAAPKEQPTAKVELPKEEKKTIEAPAPHVVTEPGKAPEIEKEALMKLLENIAKGKIKINQLDPYVCGNLDIKIGINDEKTTLRKFFSGEKKKISISNLDMVKSETNCITFLKIRYKNTLL